MPEIKDQYNPDSLFGHGIRITELEQKLERMDKQITTWKEHNELKNRIKALEKKVQTQSFPFNQMNQQKREIAEIKTQINDPLSGINEIWRKIEEELETDIERNSKQKTFIQKREEINREVLRVIGNEIINLINDKIDENTAKDNIEKQLKKLGGETEKVRESSYSADVVKRTLKDTASTDSNPPEPKYLYLKLEKKIDITKMIKRLERKVVKENNITHPSDFNSSHLKKEYIWKDIIKELLEADGSWNKKPYLYNKYPEEKEPTDIITGVAQIQTIEVEKADLAGLFDDFMKELRRIGESGFNGKIRGVIPEYACLIEEVGWKYGKNGRIRKKYLEE